MYLLAAQPLQCRCSLWFHPVSVLLLSCFYIASLWLRRFLWGGRRREVFAPSFFCVWSQWLWRNWQYCCDKFFFARTPSRIQRIVKNYDVVDRFLLKPFWFFLSIFSIWVLCGCVVEHCRSWPLWMYGLYLGNSWLFRGHPSEGKEGRILLSICLLCFGHIRHYIVGAVCRRIPWSSVLLGVFHQDLLLFYFFTECNKKKWRLRLRLKLFFNTQSLRRVHRWRTWCLDVSLESVQTDDQKVSRIGIDFTQHPHLSQQTHTHTTQDINEDTRVHAHTHTLTRTHLHTHHTHLFTRISSTSPLYTPQKSRKLSFNFQSFWTAISTNFDQQFWAAYKHYAQNCWSKFVQCSPKENKKKKTPQTFLFFFIK